MPARPVPWSKRRFQGDILHSLLDARSLSQNDLAHWLPLPPPEVSKFCCGKRLLTPYWIARIRVVLRLTDTETCSLLMGVAQLEVERMTTWGRNPKVPLLAPSCTPPGLKRQPEA